MSGLATNLAADLARLGLGLQARWGRARLPILIFHRVRPQTDELFPGEIDAQRFDRLLGLLKRSFRVLPLGDAVQRMQRGELPSRSLVITFDDGYADNAEVALPLLQKHGLVATFFIASGFIDGGCMWNDAVIECVRRSTLEWVDLDGVEGLQGFGSEPLDNVAARLALIGKLLQRIKYLPPEQREAPITQLQRRLGVTALPRDLMLSSDQLRALRRSGMEIGGHTVHHPILATLPAEQARQEIRLGKLRLESLLDEPVRVFAYPNGRPDQDYRAEHARLVQESGFEAAVSTAYGIAGEGDDRFQLPRFTPWQSPGARWFAQLLAQYPRPHQVAV